MKKIEKFFLLLLLVMSVFYLQSCTTVNEDSFILEGHAANMIGQEIKLEELTANELIVFDSVKVGNNSKFRISGNITEPKFFLLRTETNDLISLIIHPGEYVKLGTNRDDFSTQYSVEGSPDCELLRDLNLQLEKTLTTIDSIVAIHKDKLYSPKFDSIKHQLDDRYVEVMKIQKQYTRDFVSANYYSLSSIIALFQQAGEGLILDPVADMKYFEMVDTSLTTRYPNVPQVKALHRFILQEQSKNRLEELRNNKFEIGGEAPNISLQNQWGDTISLYSLRGNYVLLDFWAAWCQPCRLELPNMLANYYKYHNFGFEIYQVSLDFKREAWVAAMQQNNLFWHNVSDLQHWQSAPAVAYGVKELPTNYLLDKEGKIIAKNLTGDQLGKKLTEVFGF